MLRMRGKQIYLRSVALALACTDLLEEQAQTLDREPVEDEVLFFH